MNLSIIETNENEIRSINDIVLVNVKEIKILKNKTKREEPILQLFVLIFDLILYHMLEYFKYKHS